MPPRLVNHVGMMVSDLDGARRFYEDALGFAVDVDHESQQMVRRPFRQIAGESPLRCLRMRFGALALELIEQDRGTAPRPRAVDEPGLTHFSITTDDLEDTIARVRAAGGFIAAASASGDTVMVRDLDGQLIQINRSRHEIAESDGDGARY